MIEKALRGSPRYHLWLLGLLALSSFAAIMFTIQLREGLTVTAMSQDVPWGFYIAQLTFLVGVAASAVMVVLPYYRHDYKTFGPITILGEFLAVPAVLLCPLFVLVDIGEPSRVANIFLHPRLNSMLFWDTVALLGYLFLNLVIGWQTLDAERNSVPPRCHQPILPVGHGNPHGGRSLCLWSLGPNTSLQDCCLGARGGGVKLMGVHGMG